jgi:two-component system cell cycle response regulator
VAAAQSAAFDLILCDILLPKMDGYEVARTLRGDPASKRTPLVAVTALAMAGDSEKVLGSGFNGYISKPIDPTAFVPQVEAYLVRTAWKAKPGVPDKTAPAADSRANAPQPPHKGKVLVVDNIPVNSELLRATLEPSGYKVHVASSAREGLDLARKGQFDLIVSDLHMPGLDGLELARLVRADGQLATLAFIVISASQMTERERAEALAAGADDCIARPIEPEEILARVEAVLTRRGA